MFVLYLSWMNATVVNIFGVSYENEMYAYCMKKSEKVANAMVQAPILSG